MSKSSTSSFLVIPQQHPGSRRCLVISLPIKLPALRQYVCLDCLRIAPAHLAVSAITDIKPIGPCEPNHIWLLSTLEVRNLEGFTSLRLCMGNHLGPLVVRSFAAQLLRRAYFYVRLP